MEYKLASNYWDNKEFEAIDRVVNSRNFTMGVEVAKLEEKFAEYFGSKYCVMSNSGSSANLIGVASLIFLQKLSKGDEVIVPAVSWSTTFHPLQQYGLKVRFVDINLHTLNYDIDKLERAITKKTKMIMVVNLLGNSNDFSAIDSLCKKYNLFYVEDNCESMGATYNQKFTGAFGLFGTFSSFFSHHIATMEGGYTITNDENLYYIMKSIRAHGWTRDIKNDWGYYQKRKDDFYEKFNFIFPGYNLRPLEIEAAIGNVQLDKLSKIVRNRRKNAKAYLQNAIEYDNIIVQSEIGQSSWFGFSIILKGNLKGKRSELIKFLEKCGIQTRPIVAGNFTRNNCIDYYDYSISENLKNADYLHENGFFLGNNADDLTNEINYFFEKLDEFLERF